MKDKVAYIIGDNPELSKLIQKMAFKAGCCWGHDGKTILFNDVPVLLVNYREKIMTHLYCSTDIPHDYEIINLSGYRRFISCKERLPREEDEYMDEILHYSKDGDYYKTYAANIDSGRPHETAAFLPLNKPVDLGLLNIGIEGKKPLTADEKLKAIKMIAEEIELPKEIKELL